MRKLGEDVTEVLDYVPASFKVVRHVRPKLSCRVCETIVQLPMPSLPIERGKPGPSLLAHVLVANMPIICHSIASPAFMPVKVLIWNAQHWLIGWGDQQRCLIL